MAEHNLQSRQRAGIPRARARFLTQSIQLEEQSVGGVASLGILLTALLIVGGIGWAHITPIAEVAKSTGEIIPAGRIHQVQHLEGGIVQAIHVDDGARVSVGEVLLELRTTTASSELAQADARKQALEVRLTRLDALLSDAQSLGDEGARLPLLQRQLFTEQRQTYQDQIALFDAQQRQRRQEMAAKTNQAAALEKEVALTQERQDIHDSANDLLVVSKVSLLDVGARLARAVSELRNVEGQIQAARDGIAEIEKRKSEFVSRWRQDLRLEAEQISAQLEELSEERSRLGDRLERLSILAPVDGVVQGLNINTINAVVEPGQVILEIVPIEDELVAETRVAPRDIGHVRPGQRVDVKVSSFDTQRFGSVPGSLRSVSATTYLDADQKPFYKAEILLAQDYVGNDPSLNGLLPGMTIDADIRTGEKTVLEYILKPVYRGFGAAMRER